ncbi:hypothetical protein [Thalassotalea atypica]|uniref:hypothetical protein n=1 Tax=Thalassotalea atypica TaxID=2054316 RepID=UPI002573457C|nr:hypothetical protein [Thalassotalea atypica]
MGWIIIIGGYYSLVLIGVLVGLIYPIYYLYFGQLARDGKIDQTLKQPVTLLMFSLVSSFRFGVYSFLLLTALAFIAGILFSIWAVVSGIGT